MRIIDTHLHLVYKDRFTYPWLDGAPAINSQWTAEAYFAEALPLGIDRALHMEVDVAEAEMEAESRAMLAIHPNVVGAIAACRPENTDFPAYLERLATLDGVKAFRRILHVMPDELSQSDLFAENIRRIGATGRVFDLCYLARQLPIARELVAKCPQTQFVLDHCGVPDVAGQALDPWRADIAALAELPNVAAKISGIVAYAGPDWTVGTLRPFVEHILESFGEDRVVFGSDHPVVTLTGSLTRWVGALREIVGARAESAQQKLFSANAERLYRL